MSYISDEVFTEAMEKALKKQNIIKKERKVRIEEMLSMSLSARDELLEREEELARLIGQKPLVPLEKYEQIELVRWFKESYPGIVIMMIRNDGYRTFAERPEQLLMGLHPGASDLYVPAWKLWIEMKRVKGGKFSDEQIDFCDYVRNIGDTYLLCNGAKAAKYMILEFVNANKFAK